MSTRAIHGKLLALTKEYHWREQPDSDVRKFSTGGQPYLTFSCIVLAWWITARGRDRLADLGRLISAEMRQLGLDTDTVTTAVEDVLQENATNRELFADHGFLRCETLFESIGVGETDFADRLWRLIDKRLQDQVADWIVVAPLPRVRCQSGSIPAEGLYLIEAGDDAAWQEATIGFHNARLWNSRTGHADPRDERIMKPIVADCWIACRATGTESGAKRVANERMRTLVALLFSFHFSGQMHVLHKSGWDVPRPATYFPGDRSHTGKSYLQTHIGEIVPPLFNDLDVIPANVEAVRHWYSRLSAAALDVKKRAIVASHFVHNALVADELEQFMHFFIALDAMFGVRGNVENTIADGVDRVFGGDGSWRLRAHKLFALRSELLHGGTSSIDAWSGYEGYDRHFRSSPLNDVGVMALTSLRSYAK